MSHSGPLILFGGHIGHDYTGLAEFGSPQLRTVVFTLAQFPWDGEPSQRGKAGQYCCKFFDLCDTVLPSGCGSWREV